ncbi:unnamed protein product [Choristocarpus tenellus]
MGETMTSVAALDGRLQGLCRQLDHDVGHVARLRARYLIEQGSGNMHGRGRRSNTRGGKCEDGASSTTSTNKAQSWRTAEVAKIQERIEKAMNLCVRLGDEKIRIVQHGYDFLDTHIRRLDEDLKRMEADLRRRDLLPPPEMERSASQRKRRRASSEAEASLSTGSTAGQQVDLPVDPNEPVYCICKQVAFGEMVACDNPACEDGEFMRKRFPLLEEGWGDTISFYHTPSGGRHKGQGR